MQSDLDAKMRKIGQLHDALKRAREAQELDPDWDGAAQVQRLKGQIKSLRDTLPKLRLVSSR